MSLFDMQGMDAEESTARKHDGRSTLSTVSTAIVDGKCQDSTLSALAGVCNG